ncbi:nucleoredoxin-like protein 1 [Alosa pseudoharengus]|uniref:nucleoredoxin-like protein 1 n=1 Tax=Alosa pseudoharengus TaxID=34774 RepID=UPI003F8C1A58
MELFLGKVLVKNNWDRNELDTEREITMKLQNRILMLFFGSWDCERCQDFVPTLKDFYKRLMDSFYMERPSQLVLIYVSLDDSEVLQEKLLKKLPKWCLFLHHDDPYRKELGVKFEVHETPTVVVLRPDGSLLLPNAVSEICELGPDCFRQWQEAAQVIDRNFEMHVEFDDKKMRSVTDPIRKLKYKVEKKKKRRGFLGGWGGRDEDEDEEDQNGDLHDNGDFKGPWD